MATKLYCCEKCQMWETCDNKWYRGERGEEQVCCTRCNYYTECGKPGKKSRKSQKKY
ncbi:MAG: hypothetical protein AAB019_02580 [Planctomycetota bacterium]